ncbi:MAG: GTP cyclohydrolase II [Bradymonadaceae bacterium]|nr:GTP cyclohydrolase II [Lujinxingiaceae bacterium]
MQTNLSLARKNGGQSGAIKTLRTSTEGPLSVEIYATAQLPTRYGKFNIVAFINNRDAMEHVAIVHGQVAGVAAVLTRIHSECLTGDVFGSLKCDCGPQLDVALEEIARRQAGIILYMRQEGRGIGLANKIKAYSLQDGGLDTVEANQHLGFDDDLRNYEVSAEMLKLLGVQSIELMTNNPDKVDGLSAAGVIVTARCPIQILPNPFNLGYLETKRVKSGHLL